VNREAWLSARGARPSSGHEWVLPSCWWCGKEWHLYINLKTGKWTCFRCNEGGRWLRLYAEGEGITVEEAAKRIMEDAFAETHERVTHEAVDATLDGLRKRYSEEAEPEPVLDDDTSAPHVDTPLPEEFVPVFDGKRWRWPVYLTARGVAKRTGQAYGLGFANHGRYSRRIIIPVRCPLGRSFTARSIFPADVEPLRYDSGPGCGRLLFGWDVAMSGKRREVVIVEGPFDVLSCYQAGIPAVALLGKRLRDAQVEMLAASDVKHFTLLLDDDARMDALSQVGGYRLEPLAGRLSVAQLSTGDPGTTAPDVLREVVRTAISAEDAKLEWSNQVLSQIT